MHAHASDLHKLFDHEGVSGVALDGVLKHSARDPPQPQLGRLFGNK